MNASASLLVVLSAWSDDAEKASATLERIRDLRARLVEP
jgi:hypothetical protein